MRIVNRALSAALALALMVGGLLVAAEIIVGGLGRGPWLVPYDRWDRSAQASSWSDTGPRLLFVGLIAAGALVLLVEGARRRPESLPLASSREGVDVQLDRRSVERWLADKLARSQGVTDADTRVGRREAVVSVQPLGREETGVRQRVRDDAAAHLGELGLAQPLQVKVDVRRAQS